MEYDLKKKTHQHNSCIYLLFFIKTKQKKIGKKKILALFMVLKKPHLKFIKRFLKEKNTNLIITSIDNDILVKNNKPNIYIYIRKE